MPNAGFCCNKDELIKERALIISVSSNQTLAERRPLSSSNNYTIVKILIAKAIIIVVIVLLRILCWCCYDGEEESEIDSCKKGLK